MPVVSPPSVAALPTPPSTASPSTFDSRADAFLSALPTFQTENNAVAANVFANATDAATSATNAASAATTAANSAVAAQVASINASVSTATAQAGISTTQAGIATTQAANAAGSATTALGAVATSGAVLWVSGTTYSVGNLVYSPIDLQMYRRAVAGAGATDPMLDGVNWRRAIGNIGTVTTATTATTLTNTPTLLQVTPASYGVTVTLPNATTCSLGGPLHCIDNQGAFPVRVCDSAGTLLGFVFAGVTSYVMLNDRSTAAGVWDLTNGELVGLGAALVNSNFSGVAHCIDVGSNRELVVSAGTGYAVVYDRAANVFGTPVLVRAATAVQGVVLSAANQVLVVSVSAGATTLEAVTLTLSGTAITVNTAATATLSANFVAMADGCGLLAVGSSFVATYTTATPEAQMRAMSISGTTVTIGAASVLDGAVAPLAAAAANHIIAATAGAGSAAVYTKPYLVSGSTLTAGTGTSAVVASSGLSKLAALGTRWFMGYIANGDALAGVISLNATGNGTTTVSPVTVFVGSAFVDALVLSSSKVLCVSNQSTNNCVIVTDTTGTASIGSRVAATASTASRVALFVDGTDAMVSDGSGVSLLDCSGASPTLTRTWVNAPSLTGTSNGVLRRTANFCFGSASVYAYGSATVPASGARLKEPFVRWNTFAPLTSVSFARGVLDTQRWTPLAGGVVRMECVA